MFPLGVSADLLFCFFCLRMTTTRYSLQMNTFDIYSLFDQNMIVTPLILSTPAKDNNKLYIYVNSLDGFGLQSLEIYYV